MVNSRARSGVSHTSPGGASAFGVVAASERWQAEVVRSKTQDAAAQPTSRKKRFHHDRFMGIVGYLSPLKMEIKYR
jgi:hypothetical protein